MSMCRIFSCVAGRGCLLWPVHFLGKTLLVFDLFHSMTILDSMLKSRDITLPTKIGLVKAMVFPVVMYGCESWTVKKAERWRIDAFELWCWRKCLRVPWTARTSNQSIVKEISPEYSFRSYLNVLVVFPTFFNLSLNLAIRSSWSEPQSAPGFVLLTV